MHLYFKFLERDGNRGLGLLPLLLIGLDWIMADVVIAMYRLRPIQ